MQCSSCPQKSDCRSSFKKSIGKTLDTPACTFQVEKSNLQLNLSDVVDVNCKAGLGEYIFTINNSITIFMYYV